ncbi:unnamed protein product, partial [Arctogadus glacialis]
HIHTHVDMYAFRLLRRSRISPAPSTTPSPAPSPAPSITPSTAPSPAPSTGLRPQFQPLRRL